jgi:hypothetical protein
MKALTMKTLTTILAAAFLAATSTGTVQAWTVESTTTGPAGTVTCNGHPIGSTWITAAPPGLLTPCGQPAKHQLHACWDAAKGPPPPEPTGAPCPSASKPTKPTTKAAAVNKPTTPAEAHELRKAECASFTRGDIGKVCDMLGAKAARKAQRRYDQDPEHRGRACGKVMGSDYNGGLGPPKWETECVWIGGTGIRG